MRFNWIITPALLLATAASAQTARQPTGQPTGQAGSGRQPVAQPVAPSAAQPAGQPAAQPAGQPTGAVGAQGANGAPTTDELKDLLAQKKYSAVLTGVAKCLSLRGAASQPYDRYDLYMLRGQAYLGSKASPPAAEAFAAAQKETDDADKKSIARGHELLVRRSKATGYIPRAGAATKPSGAMPIAEEEDRKAAFAALLADELAIATPKVKAASTAKTLPQVIEVVKVLVDVRDIELAGTGANEQSKTLSADMGKHAHELIGGALKTMKDRTEACWDSASRHQNSNTANLGGQTNFSYGMMGLTSAESGALKNIITNTQKITPIADELGAVTGDKELKADGDEAEKITARAEEVLKYDYANDGRGSRTPSQTGTKRRTQTKYGTPAAN